LKREGERGNRNCELHESIHHIYTSNTTQKFATQVPLAKNRQRGDTTQQRDDSSSKTENSIVGTRKI
jgi:hypothetical protein